MHFFGQNKSLDWFKWDFFCLWFRGEGELIKKHCFYIVHSARSFDLPLSIFLSLSRLLSFKRFITVQLNCIHKHWMKHEKNTIPLNVRCEMHSDTVPLGNQHLHLNIQMRLKLVKQCSVPFDRNVSATCKWNLRNVVASFVCTQTSCDLCIFG